MTCWYLSTLFFFFPIDLSNQSHGSLSNHTRPCVVTEGYKKYTCPTCKQKKTNLVVEIEEDSTTTADHEQQQQQQLWYVFVAAVQYTNAKCMHIFKNRTCSCVEGCP